MSDDDKEECVFVKRECDTMNRYEINRYDGDDDQGVCFAKIQLTVRCVLRIPSLTPAVAISRAAPRTVGLIKHFD